MWISSVQFRKWRQYGYEVVPRIDEGLKPQSPLPRVKLGLARRTILALLALGFACALYLLAQSTSSSVLQGSSPLPPKHLRLVVPASQSNSRLCKTLISAAVLDYPAPTLINWNVNFTDKSLVFGGSHLAKIGGVLNHLETIGEEDRDDLLIIMDGYDTWLQLRPEVMIERYYAINKRANARIHKQLGAGMTAESITQKVVFSAQKRCFPRREVDPACYAIPESTLPSNVYGPDTDTDVGDKKNIYAKYRQRYLNSGLIMGPVGNLITVFKRAHKKAKAHPGFGSDQAIFADIFGEQEFQRHVIAHRHRNWVQRGRDWIATFVGQHENYEDRTTMGKRKIVKLSPERRLEFGIGLDYRSELALPTVFCEYDAEWLRFNESAFIHSVSRAKGLSGPRIGKLAPEIVASKPPFYSLHGGSYPSGQLPIDTTWNEVPLYTNIWTGVVPAAVHHNAHIDGMKSRIETWWNRTWFQPYARTLLDARFLEPMQPIANTQSNGQTQTWWAAGHRVARVHTDKNKATLSYTGICNGTWSEVFADGKGSWVHP